MSLALATTARTEEVRVGLSVPLSGNAALLGRQFEQGAQFAAERLGQDIPVTLVVVDDGCDAELADLAAEDLANAEVAVATGFLCNEAVRAAANHLAGGIPLVVAGARSERLMKDAAKEEWNIWRMAPGDDAAAIATFRILSRRWAGLPWAVVDDGTVYGRNLADRLRELMEETGQPPQFADNFRPAQSTQAGLIRRLSQSGVSAAFIASGAEDAATIWASRNQLGAQFEIAGGEALAILPWMEAGGRTDDGLLAVTRPDPLRGEAAAALAGDLSRAGIEPEHYTLLGYSAVQLVVAAWRETPGELNNALLQTRFETALGVVDFDENRINREDDYTLHVWRGGRFVPVHRAGTGGN